MIGIQHRAQAAQIPMPPDYCLETPIPSAIRKDRSVGVVAVVVFGLHAIAVAVLFSSAAPLNEQISLPTISGVLIAMPPPEAPKPVAHPKPQPVPNPAPQPVKEPPVEKALSESESVVTEPKPVPAPVHVPIPAQAEAVEESGMPELASPSRETAETRVEKIQPAPITPPRTDAVRFNNPAPVYPRLSLRHGEEGKVILSLLVHADGTVAEVSVKRSSGHPRLDKAALKAIRHWHYLPAMQNGKAIDYRYEQPIAFSLRI
jgi:protein TonB